MCGALPSLLLAITLGWIATAVLVAYAYRNLWDDAQLVAYEDLGKFDDAFRLGVGGTWDAVWARGERAISKTYERWLAGTAIILTTWAAVTAFAQTYFAVAVSRRAGDSLPHRSNLVHALRRTPRVFAAWAIVLGVVWCILVSVGWLTARSLALEFVVSLVMTVVLWLLLARMCFVVPIAVAEEGLVRGLGWAQCLARSWNEVHGRAGRLTLQLMVVSIVPMMTVGAALGGIALAQGLTGAGLGLAIATQLILMTFMLSVIVGGSTALYVTGYR